MTVRQGLVLALVEANKKAVAEGSRNARTTR